MPFKEILRNFTIPFILLFLLGLFLLNWKTIGWVFNFRAVKRVAEVATQKPKPVIQKPIYQYVDQKDQISIPSIKVQAPIVVPNTQDITKIHQALDRGVVYYHGSSLPGEVGKVIILGHSAPPGWPDIKYDRVFSHIMDLKNGDQIELTFRQHLYPYRVIEKHIFTKPEEEKFLAETTNQKLLILSTCYPPGKDLKRFLVVAELEK